MLSRVMGSAGVETQTETSLTEPATIRQATGAPSGHPLCLLVTEGGTSVSYPLLTAGNLIVGRGDKCDVVLRSPLVSREHAVVHFDKVVEIEDVGSANGTWIGSRRLHPRVRAPLAQGEGVFVGTAVLLISGVPGSLVEPSALVTPKEIEQRLQTLSGVKSRPGIGLVRIRARGHLRTEHVTALLSQFLQSGDLVAWTPDGDAWVLLFRNVEEDVATAVRTIAGRFQEWRIQADILQQYIPASVPAPELRISATAFFAPSDTIKLARGLVVVDTPVTQRLFNTIDRLACGDISILVVGETGVGKDIVASAVHDRSPRCKEPFVRVNCAALSESLLETELFGHEAGAFTGSKGVKRGLLETAQGGTVFLDEVGELPLTVQAKLLHALEAREVTRVGGLVARHIDVRFVSATNRSLERAIALGTFRSDLYFRLNGFTLVVPPLRERPDEIAALVRLFIRTSCRQIGRAEPIVGPGVIEALRTYDWPGNVRELKNVIDRVLLLCSKDQIGPEDLAATAFATRSDVPEAESPADIPPSIPSPREQEQRGAILAALEACAGNQSRAAEMLGMPRRSLVRKLAELAIPRPRASKKARQ